MIYHLIDIISQTRDFSFFEPLNGVLFTYLFMFSTMKPGNNFFLTFVRVISNVPVSPVHPA